MICVILCCQLFNTQIQMTRLSLENIQECVIICPLKDNKRDKSHPNCRHGPYTLPSLNRTRQLP